MDITVSNKPNILISTLKSKPEISVDKQAAVKFGLTEKHIDLSTQDSGGVILSFS